MAQSITHRAPTNRKQFEALMRATQDRSIHTEPVLYARRALAESYDMGSLGPMLAWLTPPEMKAEVAETIAITSEKSISEMSDGEILYRVAEALPYHGTYTGPVPSKDHGRPTRIDETSARALSKLDAEQLMRVADEAPSPKHLQSPFWSKTQ